MFNSNSIFQNKSIPDILKFMYSLNPMVGVIDGFRWCILGGKTDLYMPGFLLSIALCIVFLFLGVWYFRKVEKSFADII
jgi:lipopolysaccharide transport system permease protein